MNILFTKIVLAATLLSSIFGVSGLNERTQTISNNAPQFLQTKKETENQREVRFLIDKLAFCESGNNPNIINWEDNGSPSYGLFQYKKSTWIMGMKKYKLAPYAEDEELMNFIYDRDIQTELTKLILSEPNGHKHWINCFKKINPPKI